MDSIAVFFLLAVVVAAGFGALFLRAQRDLRHHRESESSQQATASTIESAQQQLSQQLGYLVEALQDRVDAGDKVVLERLGGLTTTVDAKVGGMSKNLSQQVDAMNSELGQVRRLVAELQTDRAQQHGELKDQSRSRDRRAAGVERDDGRSSRGSGQPAGPRSMGGTDRRRRAAGSGHDRELLLPQADFAGRWHET